MNSMNKAFNSRLFQNISIAVFFAAFFLYFAFYNRYHLSYLEQNQLFRYDLNYVSDFLLKPGSFISLVGAFITQFFNISWIAAVLMLLVGLLLFFLSQNIFNFYRIKGVVFSFIPVVFLASLHSNHNYLLANSFGWLISLAVFLNYLKISHSRSRYLFGLLSFIVLYYLAGMFSFLTLLLFIIHELLYQKEKDRVYYILAAVVLSILIPFLAWKLIFLIDLKTAWLLPISIISLLSYCLFFSLMAIYYPLIIIIVLLYYSITQKAALNFYWNLKHIVTGVIILFMAIALMIKNAYDPKNELFLNIEASYQASKWNKVFALSKQYPGYNQLVMYYTNLALYRSGMLADKLFGFRQSGTNGLWLDWKRNEIAPFYGGELYYQLGYNNEAFRWAFEAMEVKGLNPRSLKSLALTSIINRDYAIAGKFLNYLDQTLFYRSWANHYRILITDTTAIFKFPEINEKRQLLVKEDFISDINSKLFELTQLLENHPNNRMAYEYMMVSFLLKKDMESFAANIYRLKELGYKKIPQHFEEALILYSGITKRNMVPEGLIISADTQKRFHDYATLFASNRYSMNKAAEVLYKDFGNTFWYYMQFVNDAANSNSRTH
jgi:hypothetical protein